MLNTFHLQTFLAVVDAGNYTAAAELLHMSQPAVSQQIRALEEQLGDVRLFRRVGQRMVPTHAGEELLIAARELVTLAENAEQNIRALRGQVAGRVTIGCTANSGEHMLPTLLSTFQSLFPTVTLTVHVAPFEVLIETLAAQQIALLLLEEPQRRRGWESQLLGSEELVLFVPHGHPLLQEEQVTPGMLRTQPLVMPRVGSPLRRIIEDGLRRRGVTSTDLRIALEADSLTMIVQGVRNGLGVAFVPATLCALSDGLESIQITGTPLQQEWHVLRIRERSAPRAAHELYTFLTGTTARTLLAKIGLRVSQ